MYADIGGESSGLKVGVQDPESLGLERKLKALATLSQDGNTQLCSYEDPQVCSESEEHSRNLQEQTQRMIAVKNEIRNIVVPIRFCDHLERELPSVSELDTLFNTIGGDAKFAPTGSLKDVFLSNSYGKLVVQSHVMDWVNVSNTEAYYANGQSGGGRVLIEAFREALDQIEDKMSVKELQSLDRDSNGFMDSVTFLVSGYGAEWGRTDCYGTDMKSRIWSHRWTVPERITWKSRKVKRKKKGESLKLGQYIVTSALWGTCDAKIARLVSLSHEMGHILGLKDLYDKKLNDGGGVG
jgi:M6 family metalloprotease-like protein